MQEKDFDEEEKIVDVKKTIESFVEAELPEVSQQEAIRNYKEEMQNYKKKKKSTADDEENEDDEHLKRVKRELLESLERVNALEKKIFEEKDKISLKDVKVKSGKDKEKIINQMREKNQVEELGENINNEGRSRE